MALIMLTGASGAGKTAIAAAIAKNFPEIAVHHFDSIGVPSTEEMIADYGSQEGWQRAKTFEWLERLKSDRSSRNALFEGQVRIAFFAEAAAAAGLQRFKIILVDCDDDTRTKRLVDRQQPELATADMFEWARFLRTEAMAGGYDVLDTSGLMLADSVERVHRYFD
jgi:dephospho-CoA kinase